MDSFYSRAELFTIGFKALGDNVLISRKASIYSPNRISIGNNVRIDDFCLLSGQISLGSNIHISAYCALYGGGGIEMEDFTGLSPRTTILSATDDFSGLYMVGPMVDEALRNVIEGKVLIKRFAQIGASCVVLPNVTIEEGVAIGACSLVTKSLNGWTIYAGVPVKVIKERSRELLKKYSTIK